MHVHVVFYGSYYLENYSCTIQGVSTIIICSLVEIWIYKSCKIKIVSHVDLNSIKACKREFFSSHDHFCLESSDSLDTDVVCFDFLIVSIIIIEWSQLAQYWNIVFMGDICNFLIILYETFMVNIVAILCKTVSRVHDKHFTIDKSHAGTSYFFIPFKHAVFKETSVFNFPFPCSCSYNSAIKMQISKFTFIKQIFHTITFYWF